MQRALETLRGRRGVARHGAQARRSGRGRVPHHRTQARPRPDQPGGLHRRASHADRCPAQPQARAGRVPRRASRNSNSRSAHARRRTGSCCEAGSRFPWHGRAAAPACGGSPTSRPDAGDAEPAPVRAEPAESVALTTQVRSVGILAPRDEIRLVLQGRRRRRYGRASTSGDIVRKGQLLAISSAPKWMRRSRRRARRAEKARRDLERATQLRVDEVATEEQVQDLTTAYNVARSNLDAARFNARFARIEAPGDGVVLRAAGRARTSWCSPDSRCCVVGSTDAGWVVRTALADRDVVRVERRATPAQVTFDAFPGREFAGKVTRIGSQRGPDDRHVRGGSRGDARTAPASRAAWSPRSRSPLTRRCATARRRDRRADHGDRRSRRQRATVYVLDPREERRAPQAGHRRPDRRRARDRRRGTRCRASR